RCEFLGPRWTSSASAGGGPKPTASIPDGKQPALSQAFQASLWRVRMRYAMMVLTLLSASALCSGTGRCADAANTPFFNGKDTEGWEGLSQYWSVKDGALVGSTFPNGLGFNTFLCSKNKYTDFELQ